MLLFFFLPPFLLLAFFPCFPPFFLKLQLSRHEGPCGPDQMFQAAHFPTLRLMEYSWATRHLGTAQHRATRTRDHLFIYFITLLPGCLMHNNSSTCKSIFSPSCFSHSHSAHVYFSFHCNGSPGYVNIPYFIYGYFDSFLNSFYPAFDFSLSNALFLFLYITFIRQMGGEWC